MTTPIVIRDVGRRRAGRGQKVVAEIVQYAAPGELPTGVIVETLGRLGQIGGRDAGGDPRPRAGG